MPIPSRPLPTVGGRARLVHFGGGSELAAIVAVHEEGRSLDVRTESGEVVGFVLSRATAQFVPRLPGGPRLELL